MPKALGIIFDMDGTLYPFNNEQSPAFGEPEFRQLIQDHALTFFQEHFGLEKEAAQAFYAALSRQFNGEVSIGLEQLHGIPREDYFSATWNMDPAEFMTAQTDLEQTLGRITIQRGLLSAAPMTWINKVLSHLQVRELFEPAIFSGDPDIRKPAPEAFLQVARFWNIEPDQIVSIGDRESTDILPAKAIGMITLRIGADGNTSADFEAPNIISAITLLEDRKVI